MKKLFFLCISIVLLSGCATTKEANSVNLTKSSTDESEAVMNTDKVEEPGTQSGQDSSTEKVLIKRKVSDYQFYVPDEFKEEEALANIVEIQKEQLDKNNEEINSGKDDMVNFTFMGGYTDTSDNRIALFYFLFNNSEKEIQSIRFQQKITLNDWGVSEDFSSEFIFEEGDLGIIPAHSVAPLFVTIMPKTKLATDVGNFIQGDDFQKIEIQNIMVGSGKED